MSMKSLPNLKRTFCEVLREIWYDNVKNYSSISSEEKLKVYRLLEEAEGMGKSMARKLKEYSKSWDKGWWDANPDYEEKLEKRLSENVFSGQHNNKSRGNK